MGKLLLWGELNNYLKFDIPAWPGNNSGIKGTLKALERQLYGHEIDDLTLEKYLSIIGNINNNSMHDSLERFCQRFGYGRYVELVRVLSKYAHQGFNSVSFYRSEDLLIRYLYPEWGKRTNEIVYAIITNYYKFSGYVMKSIDEIRDRVDILGQRDVNSKTSYIHASHGFIPYGYTNLLSKNKNKIVMCIDVPSERPEYSIGEKALLKLLRQQWGRLKPNSLMPWKDANEVKYYSEVDMKWNEDYEKKCVSYTRNVVRNIGLTDLYAFISGKGVYSNYIHKHPSCFHHLVNSNPDMFFVSFGGIWSSYDDELLYMCVNNMKRSDDLNSNEGLEKCYKPLLDRGFSLESCELRRVVRQLTVKWSASETLSLLQSVNDTIYSFVEGKSGIMRSLNAVALKKMKMERFFNKPLHLVTEEERQNYIEYIINLCK